MKKSINGIGTIVLIMLVSIFIASCDYFNRPMLDYLEEWTNTAQVSKHTFDDTYPVIGDITNIPSGKDRVITYYLINPQSYTLDSSVTFAHDDSLVVNNKIPSDFATVEQDATDKSIIRLTLKDSVGATGILPLDGDGTEITPTITIREPNSGRFFGSYTVPVRVNSLPPRLFNAVIMKYTDSNEKYAVCFNLPAMGAGDIHRDITQITVNGTFNGQPFNKTYRVTGGGTGTISVEGLETSSISNYEVIGSEFVDMGTTFVGIKTGLDLGPTTPTCTITLTDSSGASTVTTVSTVSTLLNKIYVNGDSGDDNNTGTVSSPVKTIGNALEKLRDVPKGNVILQSDISLTGEVTVGSGISVTVTTDGSGRTVTNGAGRVFNITSGGSLILGENITLTGTNAGGSGGAVYVDGGSFTMESGSKITGSSASPNGGVGGGVFVLNGTFTMNGGIISGNTATYGGGVSVSGGEFIMRGGTIGGNDPGSANTASYDGGGVYVDGGTFEMSGGTISGNSSSRNGGGVYVDGTFSVSGSPTITGNTVSNNANNVYLPGGKTITIGDGRLTGGTIGVTAADMKAGDAVQITDTDVPGAADRFVSDISPYSIEETIATTDGETAVFLSDAEVAYKSSSAQGKTLGNFEAAYNLQGGWSSGGVITLLKDISLTQTAAITGGDKSGFNSDTGEGGSPVTIDLNGHTISGNGSASVLSVSTGFLEIEDSSANPAGTGGTGRITGGGGSSGGGIDVDTNGVLRLVSGAITGNEAYTGAGVYVSGKFVMNGGSIRTNIAEYHHSGSYGGGVYVEDGTFTMNSGTISGNAVVGTGNSLGGGVYVYIGEFSMNGGTIGGTGNDVNTAYSGGGVYVLDGEFSMSGDAAISGNEAIVNGGGVYVFGGEFSMSGDAAIKGNSAFAGGGGGVYVDASSSNFTMSGGIISGNTATTNGGGVYVGSGTFDPPQGGTISGNNPDEVYRKQP